MGILKRYRTAWSRHHRSAGFGIHSPFAYKFVTGVLRERLPYYAYDDLRTLRKALAATNSSLPTMSQKEAQMLFRVANHFMPKHILQVGAEVLPAASMLLPASNSRLCLCDSYESLRLASALLAHFAERISSCSELHVALTQWAEAATKEEKPFLLINSLPQTGDDRRLLAAALQERLRGECVVVMRGLNRDKDVKQLWLTCREKMIHGHTYTNDRTAILVATAKLQRQDFYLWF
ncbi:MAG: hypothetical protein IJ808_02030 [Muribaculaceae bacterium]|nr:hypothetical protein [Muribaculaceae bacterium]